MIHNLNNIRIVLYAPSHPGNVGGVMRAMETMGLSNLFLVKPKKYPDPQIETLAAGSQKVLQKLIVTENLEEAISGCGLLIGTSSRLRNLSIPRINFKTCGEICLKYSQTTQIAILFGPESIGLTNDLLLRCHFHAFIPTSDDFYSLNLAAAVQVMCYELRMNFENLMLPSSEDIVLAEYSEVERFYEHLETVLVKLNFLEPENPRRLMQRIRRLFNKARLEKSEINILRGIVSSVDRLFSN